MVKDAPPVTEDMLLAQRPQRTSSLSEGELMTGYGVDQDVVDASLAASVVIPGDVIRGFREDRNVRVADAARAMSVSPARISNAEGSQVTATWAERYMNAIEGLAASRESRAARRVRAIVSVAFVDDDGKGVL